MSETFNFGSGMDDGEVKCLGSRFPSDQARREHFLKLLAEKLKEPDFRAQEGFPQGSDDSILALSDPPFYTACPNPWLEEFVTELGTSLEQSDDYFRPPFDSDVKEGKNHPVYNAHTYHTKVPHRAIVRYIMHYTEPGDVILDAFGGTGMTAIAAAACGNYRELMECGYRVFGDTATDNSGDSTKVGPRRAIISDLSPIATFISANLNDLPDARILLEEGEKMLASVESVEQGLYCSISSDEKLRGRVNYVVWSDCYICRECSSEYDYWTQAVELGTGEAKKLFPCPTCGATQSTRNLQRAYTSYFDPILGSAVKMMKQVPVHINYFDLNGKKASGVLTRGDRERAVEIPDLTDQSWWCKAIKLSKGDRYKRDAFENKGITHVHHFFTWRNLKATFTILEAIRTSNLAPDIRRALLFVVTSFADRNGTKRNRFVINKYNPRGRINGPMANTLYLPVLFCEVNIFNLFREKLKDVAAACQSRVGKTDTIISTSTATEMNIPDDSIDYIFTDPPFGHNIQYSELNASLEAFLGVVTNFEDDLVVNESLEKGIDFFRRQFRQAFSEYYRVLKPGRWITVEFSNTQAAIWNSVQTAISESGFVIASVAALDKKRGGMHSTLGVTAVKQDLVITAYKPSQILESSFKKLCDPSETTWSFVEDHLRKLPTVRTKAREIQYVAERDPRILFDRLISWFVRHNDPVPLSSAEFQDGLRLRFADRDGMVFLPEQVVAYDRKRTQFAQAPQIELFVSDERSAIDWLTDHLRNRPSTYQDIHPEFTVQMGAGWRKHEEKPELSALLEDNFLRFDGNGDVPSQIHSYLSTNFKDLRGLEKEDPLLKAKAKDRWFVPDPNKAKDLEQKRERSLLKEFETYKTATKRQLKESRLEVLRAGFKTAWGAKDYKIIIGIAEKLPDETLQEDEKLLLWYDQALTRTEADA